MKAHISGVVARIEVNKPYELPSGKRGVTNSIYLRSSDDDIGSAQRVRVERAQGDQFLVGEEVILPVNVFANLDEIRNEARLSVTLEKDYTHTPAKAPAHV